MKDLTSEPQRLRELAQAADAAADEQRAAALLRSIGEPAPLSPELLLRIKSRVVGGAPKRVRALRVKVLLAAAILIASSGVVFAAQGLWQATHRTQEIIVPNGGSTRLSDAHLRRMTLVGPAQAELRGDEIALSSGVLALSSGARPTTVRSGEISLAVPARGIVEVTASAEGALLINNVTGIVVVSQHGSETARLSSGQSFQAGRVMAMDEHLAPAIAQLAENGVAPSAPSTERAPLPEPAVETTDLPPAMPTPDAALASETPKPSAHGSVDPGAALRESRMLREALVELRRDNDPRAALALLDQYSQHFPNGSLAPEATRARAEALIALGRRADALRVLDELSPAALGRSMLLVRGELRAEVNRCPEALADFSSALSQNPHDGVDERALFGRATCRSRTSDASGARADLSSYALHFPHGRFQTQVEHALQK